MRKAIQLPDELRNMTIVVPVEKRRANAFGGVSPVS
jgi:hypothetical protein